MANTVTVTKLNDGERHAVFHVYIASDGASGDLVNEVIIDPALDFDPALSNKPVMTIESLQYDLSGFNATIEFDYLLSDTPAWNMSGGNYSDVCFGKFGGIKDRSGELDGTGKLQITTNGLTALGDSGTIIIRVRKD